METLLKQILEGNKDALAKLVNEIQPGIFNLSLRFVWSREDAEDATQEILVKVITNLGKFEGRSKFTTWVYRIATNHLLNLKRNNLEQTLSFSMFGKDLENGLDLPSYEEADKEILADEVKIGCTLGMLICLDRELRIAYILGEVFEIKSTDAAEILDITPENFRKRLSQSRTILRNFMRSYCGLVKKSNACRCDKRINYALNTNRVNKDNLNFTHPSFLMRSKTEMENLYSVSAIFKSHPQQSISEEKIKSIQHVLSTLRYVGREHKTGG
jgi:RNA polymerase sigma factor (sigma-70 family)